MSATLVDPAQRFRSLYEANYGAIHAYASRRVGLQAADEIAAETFLVTWRRMDAVPGEPLPWLYGVARNVVARHWTAAKRDSLTEAALVRERMESAYATSSLDDPELWQAWERLRPPDREVLALIAWEELTVAQAARVLGCSAAVFSVRLHRARRRLGRRLASGASRTIPETELTEA